MTILSTAEALERLKAEMGKAGSPAAWARAHGLEASNAYRYRDGVLKLSGSFAEALGLQRVLVEAYVPIGEPWDPPAGWTYAPMKLRRRPKS